MTAHVRDRYRARERQALFALAFETVNDASAPADERAFARERMTSNDLDDCDVDVLTDAEADVFERLIDRMLAGAAGVPVDVSHVEPMTVEQAAFAATALRLGLDVIRVVTDARARAAGAAIDPTA